jgi:putative transcriptional regulator
MEVGSCLKNRLEEIRKQKGIKQEELADTLQVSRQTISSLENGRYNPSIVLAIKIARFFNMRVEEIFIYEEEYIMECKNCGSQNVKTKVMWGLFAHPGAVGVNCGKKLTGTTASVYSDLCLDCGEINRIYVDEKDLANIKSQEK